MGLYKDKEHMLKGFFIFVPQEHARKGSKNTDILNIPYSIVTTAFL